MTLPIPQDTPINRASIEKMDDAQLEAFITGLQERRLRSWNIYQAGLELKARKQADKDAATLDKTLTQLVTLLERATTAIEKAEKKALDVQALRLAMGETI